jgi:hypothetical protein
MHNITITYKEQNYLQISVNSLGLDLTEKLKLHI